MKMKPVSSDKGPLESTKQGNTSIPIYATTNRIYRSDPATGKRELKSEHPQFTVIYYEGSRRVKRKFADLDAYGQFGYSSRNNVFGTGQGLTNHSLNFVRRPHVAFP